ncbi:hypothetical protein AKJ16_DCAP20311, partial [Drosera capensis]
MLVDAEDYTKQVTVSWKGRWMVIFGGGGCRRGGRGSLTSSQQPIRRDWFRRRRRMGRGRTKLKLTLKEKSAPQWTPNCSIPARNLSKSQLGGVIFGCSSSCS